MPRESFDSLKLKCKTHSKRAINILQRARRSLVRERLHQAQGIKHDPEKSDEEQKHKKMGWGRCKRFSFIHMHCTWQRTGRKYINNSNDTKKKAFGVRTTLDIIIDRFIWTNILIITVFVVDLSLSGHFLFPSVPDYHWIHYPQYFSI